MQFLMQWTRLDRTAPLSLLLFSDSAADLYLSHEILARTYFGQREQSEPVATFDLLPWTNRSTSEVQREIHSRLARVVGKCSKRSMLVIENLQALPPGKLTALDIFLDSLAGKRAPFQAEAGDTIDTTNTLFVFLFQTSGGLGRPWKEYMEAAWAFEGVEFTPSALIGRISEVSRARASL
ncbi:hypothetical protein ACHHYP_10142 [Achlya hypogyna]|uniref:Uncharacterized protein n=1 Tax=Achlya hypogyna TaxID=1202772 RepID=A0A1V9ZI56_ACHHY|nr:hypothetical protein ACHHYP_10142 [Achlya hypogyna]